MASSIRRPLCIFITLLTLFLVGTVIVLSTVVAYFGVDSRDVITEAEMRRYEQAAENARSLPLPVQNYLPTSASVADPAELLDSEKRQLDPQPKIPRIIHQTWKTQTLPERWSKVRDECRALHADYEYMLWTDESSRAFITEHYPWFLPTFDGYVYPIQRADSIRYFVLHHYGGIYMDLDIGCRRNMDPLLYFDVILPATIPVGISNDLMFAAKNHPFMNLVIHNLVTFDHIYGTNYPTVMFSTGPMFLSAQYGLWPKEDDIARSERQVRVLPRRWYGKNAPTTEMGDSFFDHFYGSSWHADDAGFITFLGKFGIILMQVGLVVVVVGALRLVWVRRSKSRRSKGPIALPFSLPAEYNIPATPGPSRPNSPFPHNRPSTPVGRRVNDSQGRQGVLYYLPVWFLPNSERAGSSQGWSSYLSGVDEGRYHPLPNFSRPPSPSNDSILHAPGAHDGAFDGVVLHSIASKAGQSGPGGFRAWTAELIKNAPWHSSKAEFSESGEYTRYSKKDQPENFKHIRGPSSASAISRSNSPLPVRARSPLPPYTPSAVNARCTRGENSMLMDMEEGASSENAIEEEVDRLLAAMAPKP